MGTLAVPMKPHTKRTRISRGQSKNGCFTCKSRKVKCDEMKPHCARCKNARIRCEGYPPNAYHNSSRSSSADSSSTSREPIRAIMDMNGHTKLSNFDLHHVQTTDATRSPTQYDLSQTGLNLLLTSYNDNFILGQSALRRLLTRHANPSLSVHAACAALGAASLLYENAASEPEHLKVHFATQYGLAIRIVRQDLESQHYNAISILATCVVLFSIEEVLRRCQGASVHLRGAYQALQSNMLAHHNLDLYQSQVLGRTPNSSVNNSDVDCDVVLRVFDTQHFSSLKAFRLASLRPISLDTLEQLFTNAYQGEIMDEQIVPTIHAALALLAPPSTSTSSFSSLDNEIQRQQFGDLIQRWGALLGACLSHKRSDSERLRLLVYHNWMLYVEIAISAYFSEHETAWDAHAQAFQQIIMTAEEAFTIQQRLDNLASPTESRLRFTPLHGLLQGLYLAAMHYRRPTWRRRAIACLRRIDRQGPWVSEMLTAIAERVVQIEESNGSGYGSTIDSSDVMDDFSALDAIDTELLIPDSSRISFAFTSEEHSNVNSSQWPVANSGSIEIKFMRRKRPTILLSASSFAADHFIVGGPGDRNSSCKQLNTEDWELWTERIDFSPGTPHKVLWSTREQ